MNSPAKPPSLPWIILATSCGISVGQLDITIVNVALQPIHSSIGGGVSSLQWIVSGYTIAFAALLLSAGALSDRLGSRRVFLFGMVLFGASSLGCALSSSMPALIMGRAIQGAAAAMLVPSALALLRHACGSDKKLLAQSVATWAAIGGACFAAGPVVGGVLLQFFGWKSIFLVNLPVCALGMWLTLRYVGHPPAPTGALSFDWPGQALIVTALTCGIGAAIEVHRLGLDHPIVVAGFSISALAAVLFVLLELRSTAPILPMRLFKDARFTAPVIFGFIINATYGGLIFVLSLYLQEVMGYSTARSGLAFIPLTATFVVANLLSGKLVGRLGPRVPLIAGASIAALGYALLILLGPESSFLAMLPGFFLVPAGMGMTVPTLSTAVMSSVEANLAGTATATLNTARQIGAAAGVAIFGSLVAAGSAAEILHALQITTVSSAVLLLIAMAMAYQVHYPGFGAATPAKA